MTAHQSGCEWRILEVGPKAKEATQKCGYILYVVCIVTFL